jgi:kynurenine formamidase
MTTNLPGPWWLRAYGYQALVLALAMAVAFTAGLSVNRAPAAEAQDSSPGGVIGAMMASGQWEVVDLSAAAAENMPVWWPTTLPFVIRPINFYTEQPGPNGSNGWFNFRGPYAGQGYELDEHTATQIDCPPHFIPPPGSPAPFASEAGSMTCDKIPLSQQMGPAVVVDTRSLMPTAENGKSAHISRAWLEQWEASNGSFQPGEVVMFYGAYTDDYFRPFPEGERLVWKPLIEKSAPGWQAPDPDAMELMHERGVTHVVTDAPSMGWVEGGQPTHVAGLKYGMTWTEFAMNLGQLPVRGAFYVMATYKVRDQQAGIGRAFAFKPAGARGVGQ